MNKLIKTGDIIIGAYIALWILLMIGIGYMPNIDGVMVFKMAPAAALIKGMLTIGMLCLSPWILRYRWAEQVAKKRSKK